MRIRMYTGAHIPASRTAAEEAACGARTTSSAICSTPSQHLITLIVRTNLDHTREQTSRLPYTSACARRSLAARGTCGAGEPENSNKVTKATTAAKTKLDAGGAACHLI